MNKEHIFETLPATRLFFKCAMPSMLSMMFMSIYTMVDGIFVGRFIGENALVAVNLVMPLIMISFALSDMVAVGSSVQISIRLGEKKEEEAGSILSLCVLVIVGIAIIIGVAAFFFSEPLVKMMGADPEVAALALEYTRVFAFFSPIIMPAFALDNYLRICGKANYSLMANVATGVCNIVLDWLFMVKMGLGIWSAALATCISLSVCTILCVLPLIKGKLHLKFRRPHLSFKLLGNVMANGSSEFFSNIAGSIMMAIFNVVLLQISGSTAVAAFGIIMYVDGIVKPMMYGIGDSMQPPISYHLGAGNLKKLWALEKRALAAAFITALAVLLLMRAKGHWLIGLFVEPGNGQLLEMGVSGMKLFAMSYLVSWLAIIASSFFTSLNKPGLSIVVSLANAVVFPVIFVNLLVPALGMQGVWLTPVCSGILSFFLSCGLLIFLFRSKKSPVRLLKSLQGEL